MGTVTALARSRRRRGWVDVHLDCAYLCCLPKSAVREAGLAEGAEAGSSELLELRDATHREHALESALRYLAHRPRSRSEVERRLDRRGYEEAAVQHALARCEELGYVDDREFAATWARDRIRLRPRSPALIRSELRRKGVGDADARAGIARALRAEEVTEADLLERAARKAWRSLDVRDPEAARRRLLGYIARRGFRAGEAHAAVDRLLGEAPVPAEAGGTDRGALRATGE